jgi:AcrR family transcriptional regulator
MARVTAAERRQQLIDAAFRVMARDGVAAATTRAIAAEAGAPLASFHYCFRSKEELLRELTPALIDRMVEGAVAEIEPGDDIRDTLRKSLRGIWSVTEGTSNEQQVLYELTQYVLRNPGLEGLATWQYQRYFESAREYLQAISEATGTEWTVPLPVASRLLACFVDGMALGWIVDRNSAEARAALDAFADGFAALTRPRLADTADRRDAENDTSAAAHAPTAGVPGS